MTFDLVVIGGGINGCCIARDAAGRGLNVLLVEKDDLASHTSSASTKLIHGGLRYLEYFEFGLVRKALVERERMLRSAPHIMWPLRFVLPHEDGMRPKWLIRCGLFLYDHLARRDALAGSRAIKLAGHPAGVPLQARFTDAFEYSDGWVDDARLVVLNALDAAERGATILTRTRCTAAVREEALWRLSLQDANGEQTVHCRALVNAAGPWVAQFLNEATAVRSFHRVRLVRGSHIVVPRLFDHDQAYLFQAPNRRIVFALPYEQDFTLIGTTEVEQDEVAEGTLDKAMNGVRASEAEIAYLCEQASRYFKRPVTAADVRWHFSGVRPLLDDDSNNASAVTRDYLLEINSKGPPVLSVFGGKITTCRKLAEQAINSLLPLLDCDTPGWTAEAKLPGGEIPADGFADFLARLMQAYPDLSADMLRRMAHAYGSRVCQILGGVGMPAALGEEVLPGLFAAEILYLVRHEWARCAEDILWRRSKLGLHVGPDAVNRLDSWLMTT